MMFLEGTEHFGKMLKKPRHSKRNDYQTRLGIFNAPPPRFIQHTPKSITVYAQGYLIKVAPPPQFGTSYILGYGGPRVVSVLKASRTRKFSLPTLGITLIICSPNMQSIMGATGRVAVCAAFLPMYNLESGYDVSWYSPRISVFIIGN